MGPLVIVGGAVALYLGYMLLEKGSGTSSTVVRPTVTVQTSPGAPPSIPAASSPAGAADATVTGIPTTSTAPTSSSTPAAPTVAGALSAPADALSWIFNNGQDALKAGYGQLYKNDKGGLSITGPYGALLLKNPGTIYASEGEALKAGAGNLFQKGGNYFVTGPAGAIKVSDRFQPHVATADMSHYGSVSGVIRGWTGILDRAGALTFVPAHSVSGSTYSSDAQGAAPTAAEWQALQSSTR